MPFTITEFRDLIQLLEREPDWRAELRRWVLTDELLALPQTVQALAEDVRALSETQRRTDEQLAILTQRVDALTQRVDALTQRVDALTQRVDALTQRVDALTQRVDALTQRVDALAEQMAALGRRVDSLTQTVQLMAERMDSMGRDVSDLKGITLELHYWRHAPAYFQSIARRIYPLSVREWSTLLDQAIEEGRLSQPDVSELLQTDLVLRGQSREDKTDVYLVVEISWGVGPGDVERAAQRAKLLAQLGTPAIPVAAGRAITAEAAELARQMGTWLVMDGRAISPAD